MTKQEIIDKLKAGNQRFVENNLERPHQDGARREETTGGQSPYAIVLSCADSRVVPELAFDTGMGDLFVVRVAGNVANTSSLASMEYAVAHLHTSIIVVLGHQSCGAVTAAVQGGDNGPNLNHLLEHIQPAIDHASDAQNVDEVIHVNAELTSKTIVDNSAIIAQAVQEGKVQIVPAYYHLDSGVVDFI
jgi:carbonic anhydrase